MGDSQQPKPALPLFEVPDLELEPVLRPAPAAKAPIPTVQATQPPTREFGAPNLFDDEAFSLESPLIDLGISGESQSALDFGAGTRFDPLGGLELERNAHSDFSLEPSEPPHSDVQLASATLREGATPWPSGQALARERVALDPLELSLLAAYGEAPKSAHLTPVYAYRVFTRQRELKRLIAPLEAERARAETERDSTLADLARAVRPEAERAEQFRRLFAPLVELEQLAAQRGQALSSVNAELSAQTGALEGELREVGELLETERGREHDAQRLYEERDSAAKRAQAKLQRVQIEMRVAVQIAEQKLGPRGGEIPEPEASQLAALKERAASVQPEVDQTKAELAQAKTLLDQAAARVAAGGQRERLAERKKQALVQHYQAELDARGRGLNENEQRQREALTDIGRAVLATRGALAVPEAWLERVRATSQRADALLVQCELHLRALDAYDRPKVTQGVRLAGTLVTLAALLIMLKIAL